MHYIWAVVLTSLAGLSTGVGGILAFVFKKKDTKFLPASLGFAAGVMIYLSMTEIFGEAKELLTASMGHITGLVLATGCFFTGVVVIGAIDRFIPHGHDTHTKSHHDTHHGLMRTGVFTALAISIHNIPEGIAMFLTIMQQPSTALPLLAAVVIHNIPAGIAIAIPIYYATGHKRKAFLYALATGITQPLAAVAGYALLIPVMNDIVFGVLYASAAGFMVFIALDDLLPSALQYGNRHNTTYGLITGMAVMAVSLLIFH